MKTSYFDTINSTQLYLVEKIRDGVIEAPFAILSRVQKAGVGSRDNEWSGVEGNFFASFAISLDALPSDLPLSSASIYFSFIMKEILIEYDSRVWLKWPNDFYLGEDKIGGTITQKVDNILVCGIGINLKNAPDGYKALYSDIEAKKLFEDYLLELEQFPKWKQIFSQFEIEFDSNRNFSVHIGNQKKSLSDAILCDDGSLIIEEKKVFSLR